MTMENINSTEETITTETASENLEGQELASEESAMEASAESEGELIAETETPKEKAPAAHLAFIAAVQAHASALGLSMKDQKSFFQVWNSETGHKLYVAKQGREVNRIDTTLPKDELGDISYDLSKPNGRIVCHVKAEGVTKALDVLATFAMKLPAPKGGGKKASNEAPAVTASEEPAQEEQVQSAE